MTKKVVTIQATAKKYKLLARVGGWMLVAGVIWYGTKEQIDNTVNLADVWLILLGGAMFVWGRVGKWWNHE